MNNIDWVTAIFPIAVQIGLLVWFLGGIKSQIDALGIRIGKLELDTEKERSATSQLSLSMVRVETLLAENLSDIKERVGRLCLEASECPLAQGNLVQKRRRKNAGAEENAG